MCVSTYIKAGPDTHPSALVFLKSLNSIYPSRSVLVTNHMCDTILDQLNVRILLQTHKYTTMHTQSNTARLRHCSDKKEKVLVEGLPAILRIRENSAPHPGSMDIHNFGAEMHCTSSLIALYAWLTNW